MAAGSKGEGVGARDDGETRQRCRSCGEDIYSPDYGGDLDDYHVSDNTEAWPYCGHIGGDAR